MTDDTSDGWDPTDDEEFEAIRHRLGPSIVGITDPDTPFMLPEWFKAYFALHPNESYGNYGRGSGRNYNETAFNLFAEKIFFDHNPELYIDDYQADHPAEGWDDWPPYLREWYSERFPIAALHLTLAATLVHDQRLEAEHQTRLTQLDGPRLAGILPPDALADLLASDSSLPRIVLKGHANASVRSWIRSFGFEHDGVFEARLPDGRSVTWKSRWDNTSRHAPIFGSPDCLPLVLRQWVLEEEDEITQRGFTDQLDKSDRWLRTINSLTSLREGGSPLDCDVVETALRLDGLPHNPTVALYALAQISGDPGKIALPRRGCILNTFLVDIVFDPANPQAKAQYPVQHLYLESPPSSTLQETDESIRQMVVSSDEARKYTHECCTISCFLAIGQMNPLWTGRKSVPNFIPSGFPITMCLVLKWMKAKCKRDRPGAAIPKRLSLCTLTARQFMRFFRYWKTIIVQSHIRFTSLAVNSGAC